MSISTFGGCAVTDEPHVIQAQQSLQDARMVAGLLYHALDDASTVVDSSPDEGYAYEAELEAGAQLLGIERNPLAIRRIREKPARGVGQ